MPRNNAGIPFNVILTDDDKRKLSELARRARNSQGYVLRKAIEVVYGMEVEDRPTCATGQVCLCPHLHPRRPQPQVVAGAAVVVPDGIGV